MNQSDKICIYCNHHNINDYYDTCASCGMIKEYGEDKRIHQYLFYNISPFLFDKERSELAIALPTKAATKNPFVDEYNNFDFRQLKEKISHLDALKKQSSNIFELSSDISITLIVLIPIILTLYFAIGLEGLGINDSLINNLIFILGVVSLLVSPFLFLWYINRKRLRPIYEIMEHYNDFDETSSILAVRLEEVENTLHVINNDIQENLKLFEKNLTIDLDNLSSYKTNVETLVKKLFKLLERYDRAYLYYLGLKMNRFGNYGMQASSHNSTLSDDVPLYSQREIARISSYFSSMSILLKNVNIVLVQNKTTINTNPTTGKNTTKNIKLVKLPVYKPQYPNSSPLEKAQLLFTRNEVKALRRNVTQNTEHLNKYMYRILKELTLKEIEELNKQFEISPEDQLNVTNLTQYLKTMMKSEHKLKQRFNAGVGLQIWLKYIPQNTAKYSVEMSSFIERQLTSGKPELSLLELNPVTFNVDFTYKRGLDAKLSILENEIRKYHSKIKMHIEGVEKRKEKYIKNINQIRSSLISIDVNRSGYSIFSEKQNINEFDELDLRENTETVTAEIKNILSETNTMLEFDYNILNSK